MDISSFQMSLCLVLLLHCTAAAAVKHPSSVTVRDGADVTLSCEELRDHQSRCHRTSWIFSAAGSGNEVAVKMSEQGRIHKSAGPKSDRLRVTENCSLVVEKVSAGDAGRYGCIQVDTSGRLEDSLCLVDLSVVSITEQDDGENVTLTCSVHMFDGCLRSVRWLYRGGAVGDALGDVLTSQSACRAALHLLTSHHVRGSSSRFLSCAVISGDDSQQVTFSLQTSPEESGEDETVATGSSTKAGWSWLCVVVVVASVLVLIVIRRMRSTGDETRPQDDTARVSSLHLDPEDGVTYTSVSFTRKSSTEAQVHRKSDDEDEDEDCNAVTYSTVKRR